MKVIMFHSIGLDSSAWSRKQLSIPYTVFEKFLQYIKKNKYATHFLDDWYNKYDEYSGKEHIALTFDDGYLDNWVYLFPLLKKYHVRATIFINPEFVDLGLSLRKQVSPEDFYLQPISTVEDLGFLNWNEIISMQESGLVDIQSHSMSHNWIFCSDKVIDVYRPNSKYDWLAWLSNPSRKPYYMTENQESFVPYGFPIFKNNRALGCRRFIPDEEFIMDCVNIYAEIVQNNPKMLNVYEAMKGRLQKYRDASEIGRYETLEEQFKRYQYELLQSKLILEKKLNKAVNFLCWPGGGYDDLSLEVSKQSGYYASTLASRHVGDCQQMDKDYKRIKRISLATSINTRRSHYSFVFANIMGMSYEAQNGSFLYKNALRTLKAFTLLKEWIW